MSRLISTVAGFLDVSVDDLATYSGPIAIIAYLDRLDAEGKALTPRESGLLQLVHRVRICEAVVKRALPFLPSARGNYEHDLSRAVTGIWSAREDVAPDTDDDYGWEILPRLSLCDLDRLVESIANLSDADAKTLIAPPEDAGDDAWEAWTPKVDAVIESLDGVWEQRLTIEAVDTLRFFTLTEGGLNDHPIVTRTVGIDAQVPHLKSRLYSECAIRDVGLKIVKVVELPDTTDRALKLSHDLAGRHVVVTSDKDGEGITHTITLKPGETNYLTLGDLMDKTWTFTVIDAPAEEDTNGDS